MRRQETSLFIYNATTMQIKTTLLNLQKNQMCTKQETEPHWTHVNQRTGTATAQLATVRPNITMN